MKSQIRHSRVESLERRAFLSSASLPAPDHVVVLIEEDHSYADWAKTHNSLLIVTWDAKATQVGDSIPTLVYGPMVKPGKYSQPITQDNILRTIEDMYALSPTGKAAAASPLSQIFRTNTATSSSKAKVALFKPSPHLSKEAVQKERSSLLDRRAKRSRLSARCDCLPVPLPSPNNPTVASKHRCADRSVGPASPRHAIRARF